MSIELRLLLSILACYRLAQLVNVDDGPGFVFKTIRQQAGKRASGSFFWRNVAELLHCPHCTGVWFAALLALSFDDFILYTAAIAGGQSFLESVSNAWRSD